MFVVRRFVWLLLLFAILLGGRGFAGGPASGTRVVAHRGLLQHAPENTLGNFRACLELNLGFEFDVLRTRDGQLVCIHDDTVDRTTDGRGQVAELTLEEIRRLDAGSWFDARFAGERVPKIEEVMALVAEYRDRDVLIAVDLKAEGVEAELMALAKRHEVLDKLLFIGRTITDESVRRRLSDVAPAARTAAVANDPTEFAVALAAAQWVYFRYLPSAEEMRQVRAAGKGSFIAGVTVAGDLTDNWRRAIDVGVDAILTDHPLELAALLRELSRSVSSEGR